MSVLGLNLGYMVKYGLSPMDFSPAMAIFYCKHLLVPQCQVTSDVNYIFVTKLVRNV